MVPINKPPGHLVWEHSWSWLYTNLAVSWKLETNRSQFFSAHSSAESVLFVGICRNDWGRHCFWDDSLAPCEYLPKQILNYRRLVHNHIQRRTLLGCAKITSKHQWNKAHHSNLTTSQTFFCLFSLNRCIRNIISLQSKYKKEKMHTRGEFTAALPEEHEVQKKQNFPAKRQASKYTAACLIFCHAGWERPT